MRHHHPMPNSKLINAELYPEWLVPNAMRFEEWKNSLRVVRVTEFHGDTGKKVVVYERDTEHVSAKPCPQQASRR